MTIPTTSRQWSDAVEAASNERQLLNLVIDRPIVAWFLKGKGGRAIQLLTKVSARLGDDCWIIQGIGFDETKKLEQGHMTMAPRPLKVCLHWPTEARGWVLCEFTDAAEFFRAALAYLESAPESTAD